MDFNFSFRRLTKGKQLPVNFLWLGNKVAEHIHVSTAQIAELVLTEYSPRSVINWHRDAQPFDIISDISLAADCIFKLRPYDKERRSRKSIINVPIERRSLYTVSGEARTDWEHSAAASEGTRYSITLRTLLPRYH